MRTSVSFFPHTFTPNWIISFFGRWVIAGILVTNSQLVYSPLTNNAVKPNSSFATESGLTTQPSPAATVPNQPNLVNGINSNNVNPQNQNSSILADTCDPLQITSEADDPALCGTLRYAVNFLSINPANPAKTINFALPTPLQLVVSSVLTLPFGVSLNGGCSNTGATVTINGNGLTSNGLVLSGSNIITGVQVGGFKGAQIKTNGTGNKFSCTKANTQLPEVTVLPPDPSQVAPPVNETTATDIANSTAFLYTGSNPIQTGVAAGIITSTRVAVLRGKVLDRQNQPVSGVKIQILDHSEYGQTLSRADGMFDMAINGGGAFTVKYTKQGFLDVQRQIDVPWRDFQWLPDVTLTQLDPQVTPISLNNLSGMAVVRGSQVNDSDGTRRATLLIPTGTTATMKLGDGSTQPITNLSIRATEYTVGDNGPEAMPGTLPASSGYTYATEFSVDEAIAAGATQVNFNQPVIQYLENFLGFPVGMIVPAGYYDREKGIWIPGKNGKVVKIVSISGGLANIDVTGDGVPDAGSALSDLGITDTERQQLATLYTPGQSLWRTSLDHFTPWDYNWPYGPPADAAPPPPPPPPPLPPHDCPKEGSIIGCQNQTLGEVVGVTGTPFELYYQSDRTKGYKFDRTVQIPVSGNNVPPSLKKITVQVEIAGQISNYEYQPNPNQSLAFTWDGKDGYGRELQGSQPANISVGYVYDGVYQQPDNFEQAFAGLSGVPIVGDHTRQQITLLQKYNVDLSNWNSNQSSLNNWTLDINHRYDFNSKTLYLGDGTKRVASVIGDSITTVAGIGVAGYPPSSGDGGPATAATFGSLSDIVVGPDSSIYVIDNLRIRKVAHNGIVTTVAGNGNSGYSGDGGPATEATFKFPWGIALGPDGSIFIADWEGYSVRKVSPNGIISTVAGNGTGGYLQENVPATSTSVVPRGIAVSADGSLYISDVHWGILKVTPDGIITRIAGNNIYGHSGDGGPAREASLGIPNKLVIGPDGSIYFAEQADNNYLRKVSPDGIISTIAGGGSYSDNDDGSPASSVQIGIIEGIAVDRHGTLYYADADRYKIRKIANGIITTVAGTGNYGYSDDGGFATDTTVQPSGIAIGPNGNFYYSDSVYWYVDNRFYNRIRQVKSSLQGFALGDFVIPSSDGSEVYIFNSAGQHTQTVNALTGAILYKFDNNNSGQLIKITDGDDNITTIERDSTGNPTAIVAPGGQRTTLSINSDDYLSSIANPANQSYQFTYTQDGLLTKMIEPGGSSTPHTFEYNSLGKLTKDNNGSGGFTSLSRTDDTNGTTVTATTALGRITTYHIDQLPTGVVSNTTTDPNGAKSIVAVGTDGTQTASYEDGTTVTQVIGPDPRWGILKPSTQTRTTVSGGHTQTLSITREAALSNPDDLFSLQFLTTTTTVNEQTSSRVYDAASRTFTDTTPSGQQSFTLIDAQGRVISFTPAEGQDAITYSYDSKGHLVQVKHGIEVLTYEYDTLNRTKSRTNAANQKTQYGYDSADNLTSIKLPGGETYQLTYNAKGLRTGIIMPDGAVHTLDRNALDLLSAYIPPNSNPFTRTYNLDEELTQLKLADNQLYTFTADSGGRATGESYADATITMGYGAGDKNDRIGSIEQNPVGGGLSQRVDFGYEGSFLTNMNWTGASQGQFSYGYNDNFAPTSINLTSGSDTINSTIVYDNAGEITSFGPFSITRSNITDYTNAISDENSSLNFDYDSRSNPNDRTLSVNGQAKYQLHVTYDNQGLISQKTETIAGVTHTYDYTNDPDGQLTQEKRDGILVEQYSYDTKANRISRILNNGPTEMSAYDQQDRLTQSGSVAYIFDVNGFLKQRGADTFKYSLKGELIQAIVGGQTISYNYDGIGRRVARTDSTGTYQYLYGNPGNTFQVTATRNPGGQLTYFYYDNHGYLIAMEQNNSRFYIATDQVGTPKIVTDSSGNIIKLIDFDSFGNLKNDSNVGFYLPFGFAGGLNDTVTGLTRFGFRDYDPNVGRWTARDPALFAGEQLNLYVYVNNNPISFHDPTGLFCIGANFYYGLGGGGEYCYDPAKGTSSVCAEVGVGVGGDFSISSGGVAEEGNYGYAQVSYSCGIPDGPEVSGTVGVEISSCGINPYLDIGTNRGDGMDSGRLHCSYDGCNVGSNSVESHATIKEEGGCGAKAKAGFKKCIQW